MSQSSPAGAATGPALPPQAQARFHRFRLGEIECIALSDGVIPLPAPPGPDGAPSAPGWLALSCLLVQLPGTGMVLIDTGFGIEPSVNGNVLRTVGRVPASLAAAGVTPDQVGAVLISHIHPDHVGGLYGRSGEKLYPNATYHVSAEELAYWSRDPLDLSAVASPPPIKQRMAETAKALFSAAGNTFKTFRAGEEVLPGIGTIPLFGHAPGQVGFVLSSGGETLIFTADAIADPVASIQTPDVYNTMDMDPALAVKTRHELIAKLAEPECRNFTPHFPWPSLGRVKGGSAQATWEAAT